MQKNMKIRTILVYCWNSNSEAMTIEALKRNGFKVIELQQKIQDYHADASFAQYLMEAIHKNKADLVFSYDYFPIISMICEMNQLPYASWIYDCPMYTLYSKTVVNSYNYIFCFDENYCEKLIESGAKHVFHYPLATDLNLYYDSSVIDYKNVVYRYCYDVSFVGSLYNGSNNRVRNSKFSNSVKNSIEELLVQQKDVYHHNMVKEALSTEVAKEVIENCQLHLGDFYQFNSFDLAVDSILAERTARDREEILVMLGELCNVTLHTTSNIPKSLKNISNIRIKSAVNYRKDMPIIFHNSKINLNISSRTIETGIPQRVFDILACEGFCITNYQKEIADYFEDGKELVMYNSLEDLQEKVAYYLNHDEERKSIAKAGYEKVKKDFDINKRIKLLIDLRFEN